MKLGFYDSLRIVQQQDAATYAKGIFNLIRYFLEPDRTQGWCRAARCRRSRSFSTWERTASLPSAVWSTTLPSEVLHSPS